MAAQSDSARYPPLEHAIGLVKLGKLVDLVVIDGSPPVGVCQSIEGLGEREAVCRDYDERNGTRCRTAHSVLLGAS